MHRVEVFLKQHLPDPAGLGLVKDINDLGITAISGVRVVDVYWLDADLSADELDYICLSLLVDPVTQDYKLGFAEQGKGETDSVSHTVEVTYNAGVADPVENSVMKALRDLGMDGVRGVKTARRYLLRGQINEQQLEII